MTGTKPSAISFLMSFTFTSVTSPTKPKSIASPSSSFSSFWQTSTVSPGSPLGLALAAASASQTSRFTVSSSVLLTIAIAASSVTRSPFTNDALRPDASMALVIALPPPCTTTTLIPAAARKAMSLLTLERTVGSGSSMKLPAVLDDEGRAPEVLDVRQRLEKDLRLRGDLGNVHRCAHGTRARGG